MDKLTHFYLAAKDKPSVHSHPVTPRKKRLSFRLIPALCLSLAVVTTAMGNPAWALRRGDRGPEVTELQKQLQAKGYYSGEITGFYGSSTRSAVRKFQQENNLKVDGIAGRRTLKALQSPSEKTSTSQEKTPTLSPLPTKSEKTPTPSPLPTKPEATKTKPEETAKKQPETPSPLPTKPEATKTKSEETAKKQPETPSPLPTKPEATKTKPEETAKKQPETPREMVLKKTISGSISPKSVVYSGKGLFFAQNMMYSHTITVYDHKFNLIKTIPDQVNLADYGFSKFKGQYQGSPVEAAFTSDGKYAYISNYQMYGAGFKNPGNDRCSPAGKHDSSFLYRINTNTLKIESVIPVGSVPKFNAVSPDNRFVLVSNWCSWDLSVIDTQKSQEIKRVPLGAYPRGIAVDPKSENAYVAVMGSWDIAKVNLKDFSVGWLRRVGNAPRHLNIDPAGKYLYATLNGEGTVAKIDLQAGKVVDKVATGRAPRSMVISDDGQVLYVVNYFSNTVSKVRTSDLKVLQTVNVNSSPIGITYDPQTKQVWVACYSGSIMVFQD